MSYKRFFPFFAFLLGTFLLPAQVKKAPAYPLITSDPGFSIWAYDESLPGATIRQTGLEDQALLGIIRTDSQTCVFLGQTPGLDLPRAIQNAVVVGPTITSYDLMCGTTNLELRFVSPLLPTEMTALGRAISYVEVQVSGTNRTSQKADIYLGVAADLVAAGDTSLPIFTETIKSAGVLHLLRAGVEEGSTLNYRRTPVAPSALFGRTQVNHAECSHAGKRSARFSHQWRCPGGGIFVGEKTVAQRSHAFQGNPAQAAPHDFYAGARRRRPCPATVGSKPRTLVKASGRRGFYGATAKSADRLCPTAPGLRRL